jgi:predicted  nucleic acid-binding Zn-ribbon protein
VILEQEEIVRKISTLEAEVKYLKERDTQLNGTIQKVDAKVDTLKNWLIATLAGVLASIFVNLVK